MTTPPPASLHPPVRCAVTGGGVFKDKATQIKGFMSPERSSTGSQRLTAHHCYPQSSGSGRSRKMLHQLVRHHPPLSSSVWVLSHLELQFNPEILSAPHASAAPDIPDAPDSTWNGTAGFRRIPKSLLLNQTESAPSTERKPDSAAAAEEHVSINMISYWSQYFTLQQRLKTQQINVSAV